MSIQGMQDAVDEFLTVRNPIPAWRVISMLTEEAGEVQGAFNKWQDGRKGKPKDHRDVYEELVQLTACCFVAAQWYEFDVDTLLWEASCFLREKAHQIRESGWTSDDQLGGNP